MTHAGHKAYKKVDQRNRPLLPNDDLTLMCITLKQ